MNPELIIWDYGKEITVTLEDALYSPASMGMTWGGKYGTKTLELYGTIQTSVDGEVKGFNGKLIIENFSNFTRANDNTWVWRSNVKAISNNGLERYRGEDIGIGYNLSTKEYGGITGTHDGNIISGSNSPIILNTINQNDGKQKTVIFNIDKEKNKNAVSPQEVIYQIDHALKNVKYLERIEKCKATQTFVINTDVNTIHGNYRYLQKYSEKELTVFIDPKTMQPYEPNTDTFTRKNGKIINGNLRIIKQYEIYYKWTRTKAIDYTTLGHQIIVDPIHFPGTYRLVGETYSRSRKTGKDERFQFEIPLCKMGTENSFTLEAEGDPTTFNMTLKVLRREDGVMMKLTQYAVENAKYGDYISDSTNVVPSDEVVPEDPIIDGSE